MASGYAHATIAGNLTRDPEVKYIQSGKAVCSFAVAVNGWAKSGGEAPVSFFEVSVWGKRGETVGQYLKKGSGVIVGGTIRIREYEARDGSRRKTVEITADEVVFMPRGAGAAGGGQRPAPRRSEAAADEGVDEPGGQDRPAGSPGWGAGGAPEEPLPALDEEV